jgi:predicted oxidoreductase
MQDSHEGVVVGAGLAGLVAATEVAALPPELIWIEADFPAMVEDPRRLGNARWSAAIRLGKYPRRG